MKQKRSIARMAVSAGLALAMATGMAAPATVAFADDAMTGNITISQTNGQETSFLGYKIFTGKVIDSTDSTDGKKVSDIEWASPDVKAVVEEVAKNYGSVLKLVGTPITHQFPKPSSSACWHRIS